MVLKWQQHPKAVSIQMSHGYVLLLLHVCDAVSAFSNMCTEAACCANRLV